MLQAELQRVTAPPELWDRVETPPLERRVGISPRWSLVFAGVAAAVVALAWGLRSTSEIRSSDPEKLKSWVHAHAGLDVPIAVNSPARLEGARLVSASSAEISYKVGDLSALLLVAKASPGQVSGHARITDGAKTTSWTF